MTAITPYDDARLVFRDDRYELALEEVKRLFPETMRDDGVLARRIKKNSRIVYNYLTTHCYTANQQVVLWLVNKTKEGRKFIYAVLMEQMEADMASGYNDLIMQMPINMTSGAVIPREELKRNQITVATEQLIEANTGYFGFNIMLPARYPNSMIYASYKAANEVYPS